MRSFAARGYLGFRRTCAVDRGRGTSRLFAADPVYSASKCGHGTLMTGFWLFRQSRLNGSPVCRRRRRRRRGRNRYRRIGRDRAAPNDGPITRTGCVRIDGGGTDKPTI